MANSTNHNPLYFDTVTAASKTGHLRLRGIMWVSDEGSGDDIAADDDFLVTDSDTNVICGKRAEFVGDDFLIMWPDGFPVNGIIVSKLDGGVCYIYTY